MLPSEQRLLTFYSGLYLSDQIFGSRAKRKIEIFPNTPSWNYKQTSLFLNQLVDFIKPNKRPFMNYINEDNSPEVVFYFNHMENKQYCIWIHVSHTIRIYASKEWLSSYWYLKSIFLISKLRKGNRIRAKPKLQKHFYYEFSFSRLLHGTRALIYNIPVLYTGIYDYSDIFHYYIKKMNQFNLIFGNDDSSFMVDYFNFWFDSKNKTIKNLDDLKSSTNGYLKLNIQKSTRKRRLTSINYEGDDCFILTGIFISPYAKSILELESITCGLLLDTTFRVMPGYVTSILMASIKNIGIPISFSFGTSENTDLYKLHFDEIKKNLNIDISTYFIESDQGSALISVCQQYNVTHFFCLRHLLVSLKFNEFSYPIGILVRCASPTDYEEAKKKFASQFQNIKDPKKK